MDGLIEVKTIERAETNLFRSYEEVNREAGSWVMFFDSLLCNEIEAIPREIDGMLCERGCDYALSKNSMRYTRWIKIQRGNDIFVAMLAPHEYSDGPNLKPYMDYRFVVATNNNDLLTTVILYQDDILSENA